MQSSNERLDSEDVARYAASLKRLARALVGDAHLAEDLVQDAWVMALRKPPRVRTALGGWLATVAQRLARNEGRSSARRTEREERAGRAEAEESHALVFERLEVQRKVLGLVSSLREPYRTTIYLRYWEELAPKAIAARLGVPVETVKTRLARGLADLRERLDSDSGAGRSTWIVALLPVAFPRELALPLAAGGAATTPVALLGGTLVLKHALLVVVGLVLLLLGLRVGRSFLTRQESALVSIDGTSMQAAEVELADVPMLSAIEIEPEEREVASTTPEIVTGELLVRLEWSDGAPARAHAIEASCSTDPATREERFRAMTDDGGVARFPALFAGDVVLWVDRGDRLDTRVERGTTSEVEFTLPLGDDVAGRVELSTGEPVVGAEIWLDFVHGPWPTARKTAISDASGAFRVHELLQDSRLGARADGLLPSTLFEIGGLPVGGGGAREILLVLEKNGACGSVIGRVLDPTGAPIAKAQVKIGERGGWILDLPSGLRGTQVEPIAITTDESGVFRHPGGLPLGENPVHVTARGWPVWSGTVSVEAGRTTELEVRLETPAAIAGTVFDRAGNPMSDVEVVVSRETDNGWYREAFPPPMTKTDAEGRFRLEWVAPGERVLVASDWQRQEIGKATGRVQCNAGATISVELVLDRGETIEGRLVDAAGAPLSRWRVRADPGYLHALGRQAHPRTVSSAVDGTFVVPNLEEGIEYEIQASGPDDFPIPPRVRVAHVVAGTRDLQLTVENAHVAHARVRGELRDASNGVPRDVDLVVWPVDRRAGAFVPFDPVSGEFDYGELLPGQFFLQVSRGGQGVFKSEPFEVTEGEIHDAGTLRIEEGGRLELEIAGVPLADLSGLHLTLNREGYSTETLSLENDRLYSRLLAPGKWVLTLGLGGGWFARQQDVEIFSGETEFLEVTADRSVKVPVVCSFADPSVQFERLQYEVRDMSGDLVLRDDLERNVDKGHMRLHGLALPAGEYELEVWTDSGLRAIEHMQIGGGTCAPEREIVLR